ncbi:MULTISPECIES: hypothetical protein [unclassified Maribacter]|uniref:hypothetical protein n=1 Tax=unclassified Maribacter TaxID=2615042 RepID=UPI000EBBD0D1|nr:MULTISPECIES: hypothetical protein [unclassified Maribacter]HAI42526.1 hypothetical protein [Maribacter sp.]|tara:strand:+ start:24375 stop:24689 length:315 start_codon:yes stop_codon:yes gene_type:complete
MKVVFQSKFYTLYQSDKEKCHYLDMNQKTIKLSFCQLLALRNKVQNISIENHFDSDLNKHGFEVLMLCNKEHLFILNTIELLDLKTLVDYSFISLDIDHIVTTP